MRRSIVPVLLFASVLLIVSVPALAQTPTPNEVDAVAKELWCPLCNGVRLDNCELQACIQMREVIAQKLEEGDSKDQIKAYFVSQYGDVVLGAPAAEGFNRIVWIFPVLAAVAALGWLIYFVRLLVSRRAVPQANASVDSETDAAADEYSRRVDDELRRYK